MLVIDNKFVKEWSNLIRGRVHQRVKGGMFESDTYEELTAEVWVRVLNKARSYDPERSAISTWLYMQVDNVTWEWMQKRQQQASTALNMDIGVEYEKTDEEADGETTDFLKQEYGKYRHALSKAEAAVMDCMVLNGMSRDEVGVELDYHVDHVSRIKRAAVKRLKHVINKGYRVSPDMPVDGEVPLSSVIMQMDDAHYHTYRLRMFLGWGWKEIAETTGIALETCQRLVKETQRYIRTQYGVRA